MSIPAKKGLGNALWILAALLLLSALIGYCTPISQIEALEAEGKSSLLYAIGRFISGGSLYLLIGGIVVLAFRMFGLQFAYGTSSAIKSWKTFFKAFPTTTFMLPGVLVMFFLSYLPMPGIVLAFKTYVRARRASVVESIARSQWVGLNNFDFISSGRVQAAIGNTFFFNFFWMILGLVVSVALAIALSHLRNKRAVKFYQTGVFMPYFLSWVIASYLLFALISDERGLLRSVLIGMGVYTTETMPKFYQSPGVWPLILTLANQWKYMGYNSIVYTAAISGIDGELYEAATLDGATTWGKIRHITLPMLKPMMIILTIMAMGRMANADFGLFYNLPMSSGQLLRATEVFDTYVYRMLMSNTTNMGITAAGSLFQSALGFVLIFTSNMVVRKVSPDNSLF